MRMPLGYTLCGRHVKGQGQQYVRSGACVESTQKASQPASHHVGPGCGIAGYYSEAADDASRFTWKAEPEAAG